MTQLFRVKKKEDAKHQKISLIWMVNVIIYTYIKHVEKHAPAKAVCVCVCVFIPAKLSNFDKNFCI